METHNGIITTGHLLVVDQFDYDHLWNWFESILIRCDSEDWTVCVEQLRRFLDWEYDNYIES